MSVSTTLGALGVPGMSLGYFVINIDPILLRLGPLAIHWYGLMYVVAIGVALWALLRYARGLGMHEDQIWSLFIWTAIAGLIGGRLYFVVQQPNLVQDYLLNPINIIAVWKGGMAFFGAIFVGTATLFFLAPRYGLSRYIAIDGGAFFAAVGQIFGRVGNIINGDITGTIVANPVSIPGTVCAHAPCIGYVPDQHILSWAVVYLNDGSFAAHGIAYQPAPVYEMLLNLVMLAILIPLRYRLPRIRAGYFFLLYFALYATSQLVVFFARGSEPITPLFGVSVLKQAQWTALAVLALCIPLCVLISRTAQPWPYSEEHPVPWSPNVGAAAAPPQPASGAASSEGAARQAEAADAKEANTSAMQKTELPPWQPARVVGGGLRNTFGSVTVRGGELS